MKCTEFLTLLKETLDDVVPVELRERIERHIGKCGHCEVVFNTTKKTIAIYKDAEEVTLPEDVRSSLHQAIMTKCKAAKCGGQVEA